MLHDGEVPKRGVVRDVMEMKKKYEKSITTEEVNA